MGPHLIVQEGPWVLVSEIVVFCVYGGKNTSGKIQDMYSILSNY